MIKDLVVNLTVGTSRDVAGPFAISLAEAFEAHVAAAKAANLVLVLRKTASGIMVLAVDTRCAPK